MEAVRLSCNASMSSKGSCRISCSNFLAMAVIRLQTNVFCTSLSNCVDRLRIDNAFIHRPSFPRRTIDESRTPFMTVDAQSKPGHNAAEKLPYRKWVHRGVLAVAFI